MNFSLRLSDLPHSCLIGAGCVGLYWLIQECRNCRKNGESRLHQLSMYMVLISLLLGCIGLMMCEIEKIWFGGENFISWSLLWNIFCMWVPIVLFCLSGYIGLYDNYLKLKARGASKEEFAKLYFHIALGIFGIIISTLAFNGITPSMIKAWWKTF